MRVLTVARLGALPRVMANLVTVAAGLAGAGAGHVAHFIAVAASDGVRVARLGAYSLLVISIPDT
jgi:hypothetical protein